MVYVLTQPTSLFVNALDGSRICPFWDSLAFSRISSAHQFCCFPWILARPLQTLKTAFAGVLVARALRSPFCLLSVAFRFISLRMREVVRVCSVMVARCAVSSAHEPRSVMPALTRYAGFIIDLIRRFCSGPDNADTHQVFFEASHAKW